MRNPPTAPPIIAPLFTALSPLPPPGVDELVAESGDELVVVGLVSDDDDVVISVDVTAVGSVLDTSGAAEVLVSETPIVVITEGVPIIMNLVSDVAGPGTIIQHTCKEQNTCPSVTVDVLHICINAIIHVHICVLTLAHPMAPINIINLRVDAYQRATRTPKGLISTSSTHELRSSVFEELFASGLTQSVGEARVALSAADGVGGIVSTGRVIGRKSSAGEVARCVNS